MSSGFPSAGVSTESSGSGASSSRLGLDPRVGLLAGRRPRTVTVKSSITGLASRVSAIRRTSASRASSGSPSSSTSNRLPCRTSVTPLEAQPGQRAEHGLALGVEDLALGHHVDDVSGHGSGLCGRRSHRSARLRRQSRDGRAPDRAPPPGGSAQWPGRLGAWHPPTPSAVRAPACRRAPAPARVPPVPRRLRRLRRRAEGRRLPLRPRVPRAELHDRRHRPQAGRADHRPPHHRQGRARRRAVRALARALRRPDLLALREQGSAIATILSTALFGIVFGLVWALVGYAATRGQRDFCSVKVVVATRYEVLVEHKLLAQAQELLAQLPGGRPNPFA